MRADEYNSMNEQPDHDPEIVRAAMQQGIPVAEAEGMAGISPTVTAEAVPPDAVFTRNINVIDEYNKAASAIKRSRRRVIQEDDIAEATAILQRYKAGKASLENRIIDNEEYYRLLHWGQARKSEKGKRTMRNTAWLFNACANKVADFMDNYPSATVTPREQSDEKAATQLTAMIEPILERTNYKTKYRHTILDAVKNGTGIQQVKWEPSLCKGLGDVDVVRVDPLNIFWEPGIENIQQSANVFLVELRRNDDLIGEYKNIKDLKDHLSSPGLSISKYIYNDSIDNSDKSYVVHWYYKKHDGDRTVLHYCRYVNDVVLFASENDSAYDDGWYRHGMYPFVFFNLYPEVGTPFGFGIMDIGRDSQEDIDEMNAEIVRNAKQSLRRRYFAKLQSGINEEEFADLDKYIVHVAGNLDDIAVREIVTSPISAAYLNIYNRKIDEQKEVTSNRDVTNGGVSGTKTASGIAALQESGNKTSRDFISSAYESFKDVCIMVIELIRQFYDIPRSFRILGEDGQYSYSYIDNSALQSREIDGGFGTGTFMTAEPIFDVSVKAYKQNPWSKASQNQDAINLYNMGFFVPGNYVAALACLEVMDIDNKDKLKQIITQNGMEYMQQQMMAAQMAAMQGGMPQNDISAGGAASGGSPSAPVIGEQKNNNVFGKAAETARAGTQPR